MIDVIFERAVRHFWLTRDRQIRAQEARGTADQGTRGAVTGGKQMDGFVSELSQVMIDAGVDGNNIHTSRNLSYLPGYFRPYKSWDIVVVHEDQLIAVIELKSHVGSFGNNYNNRVEEALGSSEDIWTAYREGAFGDAPAPWVGYLLVLEDTVASRRPVGSQEPHFQVFPEYKNASYLERYIQTCRRLVRERKYTAACLITSNRDQLNDIPNYGQPANDLSVDRFIDSLVRHVGRR